MEIKDIIEELDIMLYIHKRQRDLMKQFRRHVEHILDPSARWNCDPVIADRYTSERTGINDKESERRRDQLGWFWTQYHELLAEVNDWIDQLEGLMEGAKSTAEDMSCHAVFAGS